MSDHGWRIVVQPAVVERVLAAAVVGAPVVIEGGRGIHVEIRVSAAGEIVPMARLAWEGAAHRVVALACFRAAHGVAPVYREIQRRLEAVGAPPADARTCRSCGGTGWLPVADRLARESAMIALTMGAWRGVALPRDPNVLESLRGHGAALSGLVS